MTENLHAALVSGLPPQSESHFKALRRAQPERASRKPQSHRHTYRHNGPRKKDGKLFCSHAPSTCLTSPMILHCLPAFPAGLFPYLNIYIPLSDISILSKECISDIVTYIIQRRLINSIQWAPDKNPLALQVQPEWEG